MTDVATTDLAEAPVGDRPAQRSRLLAAAVLVLLLGLVAGLFLGRGMGDSPPNAVALGFVRDMQTHHAQAVRMSEIVHRRSPDPAVNYLAFDVLSTQQGQIGIMTGWLEQWSEPHSSSAPVMAWMGSSSEGPMPGMATEEELRSLDTVPVQAMTEQYLRLMIQHHRGALPMAQCAAENAGRSDVVTFASSMNAGQASEIDLMQDMLAERGWEPEPADGSAHPGH